MNVPFISQIQSATGSHLRGSVQQAADCSVSCMAHFQNNLQLWVKLQVLLRGKCGLVLPARAGDLIALAFLIITADAEAK